MTVGWHLVMEFSPSLVGCVISSGSHSFEMIRRSKECTINVPTLEIVEKVVGIGNSSGEDIDKFKTFGLTAEISEKVDAPRIAECYASLECKLYEARLIKSLNFFVFEVVAACAAREPKYPKTIHYRGDGVFTVPGSHLNLRKLFKSSMLS